MTTKNEKLDEKFESSFDVNASIEEPVDKGSNARPADKTDGEKAPRSLTKAQMISGMTHASYKLSHPELTDKYREFFAMQGQNVDADANRATIKAGGLKEDMDAVFEGSDLSEEFKDKATTIFEAAVNSAIVQETARLEEEFEEKLEVALEEQVSTLSEAIEKYLDHVADQWIEENKLQIETGLRADIAEAFLSGLKNLFVEHYVEVPEDAVDVVEALTTQVEELTNKLNESENAVIEAEKKIQEAAAATVLATVSEGLTDSQREKLSVLAENLSYDETFETKLTQIKVGLIEKKEVVPADTQLNEEVDLVEEGKAGAVDPMVSAALSVISKNKR
jgi:hypothetical protein